MASTKKHKCASAKNYAKNQNGHVSARYFAPIKQHNALKILSKDAGKKIGELTNELIAEGLKTRGYKF